MSTSPEPLSRTTQVLIWILLLLGGVHCARSIFFDNVSYISLQRYAAGTERNPFQERAAMVPVLHAAEGSSLLARAARALDSRERMQLGRKVPGSAESMTALKLASLLIGVACVLAATVVLGLFGRARYYNLWWLPPALLLAMLYVSVAARSEQAYWYPYDLPHMLLFGAASVCILTGRYWWMLFFFALDTPFRETSLFLVPLTLSLVPWRLRPRGAALLSAAMVLLWVVIRLPITHYYAHNGSELAGRIPRNLENVVSPLHVAQIASMLGFLFIPVWLGRRFLPRHAQNFLWLTLPGFVVTAYYGIWIETRITIEWTMPFAVLASAEFMRAMNLRRASGDAELAIGIPAADRRREAA